VDWLIHGAFNLGDIPEQDRPTLAVRKALSEMYGVAFGLRMWPQRGFKEVVWWSEKQLHRDGAAYFVRVENDRGPVLFVGINVEKGYEDHNVASRRARQLKEPVKQFLLSNSWDWHRALASLPNIENSLQNATRKLGTELYCWMEFRAETPEERYFVVKPGALYRRGKFKPIRWSKAIDFASRPRPKSWGRFAIARAFSVAECTPALSLDAVLDVFRALRETRDAWRGLRTSSGDAQIDRRR
jgi:hypothetical protein